MRRRLPVHRGYWSNYLTWSQVSASPPGRFRLALAAASTLATRAVFAARLPAAAMLATGLAAATTVFAA